MPDNNIKRVNIRMGQELHDWFQKKSDELAVPTSALMIIALNEYRKLQVGADHMPMLGQMLKMIQEQGSPSEAVLDMERTDVIA